tara:strand:+ start:654 stop:935 length:282 start_codon:yes stop_codon:yes gene_type:complete
MLINTNHCENLLPVFKAFDSIVLGYTEIYYKSKLKQNIPLFVRLKGKDHLFSVENCYLEDIEGGLMSVKHQVINKLDLNNIDHIKFKNFLLKN